MADSDSVYLFSKDMQLGATLPLTLEDVALHRHLTVNGCYEVNRDPLLDPASDSILDPDGDAAYAVEMKYGSPVAMQRCKSKYHRGRKTIPATNFAEGSLDEKCRPCMAFEAYLKGGGRTELARAKKGWKRLMRNEKLGKGGIITGR